MKSFFELREENTQLTVGDYTTKHFDICPSAVKLYSKIKDMTPMVHLVVENMMLHDLFFRLEKQAVAQGAIDADDLEKADHYAEMIMDNAEQMGLEKEHSYIEDVHMARFEELAGMSDDEEDDSKEEDVSEKTLTPAELKKREEVAKAIKRENPNMPMAKKMAIATATAKKVAEERVISGGYRDQEGKYHPPKTATSSVKDRLAQKAAIMQKTAAAMRKEEVEESTNLYSIQHMSSAKLKFHATNNMPHGSYSNKQIKAEHDRRMRTEPAYAKTKASLANTMPVKESADMSKLKLLARAGLVDPKDVERLMAAFKVMQAGKPLTQQQKDLVISSYGELASIVTGDSQTFQKAKKAVSEAVELGD